MVWLSMMSVFFYAWWNPSYVFLLLLSVAVNFCFGFGIARLRKQAYRWSKVLLILGISADLGLLGYYKYANFFLDALINSGVHTSLISDLILPLGISFFTFTQIAFLVDAHQGKACEFNFIHYLLFVTYFPHLIAGPILHHGEMMSQFAALKGKAVPLEDIASGLSLFVVGLLKKVLIADSLSVHAGTMFDLASQGYEVTFFESWAGSIAYTLQLYFDFSGYSDMALGLSLLFGIRLPLNFYSPYKATNIIEFWRRWHMTLSRFLKDYLYIPLGGNRRGTVRRYVNLLITMVLGGLWHGAGWTFVVWGVIHGLYLIINHAWRAAMTRFRGSGVGGSFAGRYLSLFTTFIAVCVAWVVFRAPDMATAWEVLSGMAGANGISLPITWRSHLGGFTEWVGGYGIEFRPLAMPHATQALVGMFPLLLVVWFFPNTYQLFARYRPALEKLIDDRKTRISWYPSVAWSCLIGMAFVLCILSMGYVSEFLYFQF